MRILTRVFFALLCGLMTAPRATAAADEGPNTFDAQAAAAGEKLKPAMPTFAARLAAGDLDGAIAAAASTFPPATRTPAQTFLLGNVLFEVDPKRSYDLHKSAAAAEPENSSVIWEWALEQHRAKDWAGALKSYEKFSKTRPGLAAPYALQCDCLLRLNRVPEAAAAWKKSEDAPGGSIEQMESLVCAVHREPAPHAKRAALLARVAAATDNADDAARAAADLIALDCDFPHDWWNAGVEKRFLDHDLALARAALKDPRHAATLRAVNCAAECAADEDNDAAAIKTILGRHGLLTDAAHTVPAHGGLLSVIVAAAARAHAIDEAALRRDVGPKVLALARAAGGKDVPLWNVAAYTVAPDAPAPDDPLGVEYEGWRATGDPRFAAGALQWRLGHDDLKSDDPELAAALKQFPDSAIVWRIAYEVATRDHKVTPDLLAGAARAEFAHFSSYVAFATVVDRPRAGRLRAYLRELETIAK